MMKLSDFDLHHAVSYHHGAFPPALSAQDIEDLVMTLLKAQDALSRYDQALMKLPSRRFFVGSLSKQEAVLSSRMEGTISTMDEVMLIGSNTEDDGVQGNQQAIEVLCYATALQAAQIAIEQNSPINEALIRATHQRLMRFGRGSEGTAGQYKSQQNYVADRRKKAILFTPIAPEQLAPAMQQWMHYIENPDILPLIRLAIAHAEFEALHPFDDANGRIGRLLVPLLLWKYDLLKEPHFFISAYLEEHREEYIERMRAVSADGDWVEWVQFFLEALIAQSYKNLDTVHKIQRLYEEIKPQFRELTGSKWAGDAQDFMFSTPMFKNTQLARKTHMPPYIAARMTKLFEGASFLREVQPSRGRRGAIYSFEPLMELIRV